MKTITIPKSFGYPTVDIVINNVKHTLKSGEEITIDDYIAEVVENAIALAPKQGRYLSMFDQYVEGSITKFKEEDLDGAEIIAPYVFYKYDNLQSVVVPKGVTSIGLSAFRYCAKLTRVEIAESVSSIGDRAFANCITLARVILRMPTPPILQAETFAEIPNTCVFEVPSGAVEAYKSAEYWSAFANRIVAIKD